MSSPANSILSRAVRDILLFRGLSPTQIQKFLNLCSARTFGDGEFVCEEGTASDAMFLLISGELEVVTREGLPLATIHPVSSVGEMGVMTREPRSATARAVQTSRLLTIEKSRLDLLTRLDREIQVKLYRNTIDVLAARVRSHNRRCSASLSEPCPID